MVQNRTNSDIQLVNINAINNKLMSPWTTTIFFEIKRFANEGTINLRLSGHQYIYTEKKYFSAMQIFLFLSVNKLRLSGIEFNEETQIKPKVFKNNKRGNQIPPKNMATLQRQLARKLFHI